MLLLGLWAVEALDSAACRCPKRASVGIIPNLDGRRGALEDALLKFEPC